MTKEIIATTIARLKETPDLYEGGSGVVRGKFGAKTIAKAPACIVMPDFGLPVNIEDNGELDSLSNKKPKLVVTLFLMGIPRESQEAAEDYVTDLFETTHERMTSERITVARGGNTEYRDWEFSDMEWMERAQTGCTLAIEYKMKIWL